MINFNPIEVSVDSMTADKDRLKTYRGKRNLKKSPEPGGGRKRPRKTRPRFVIQKHDASRLHYDFRLEAGGVLKSWAVPKGLSTDPSKKRLAVPTEDHPLDYLDFEGTIPEGQYGAGTVMVWDIGEYRNLTHKPDDKRKKESLESGLKKGHIAVWLKGKKLQGGYALTRTDSGKDERWLLVKMDDEEADARRNPVSTQKKSALTGRTMNQIRKDARAEKDASSKQKKKDGSKSKKS